METIEFVHVYAPAPAWMLVTFIAAKCLSAYLGFRFSALRAVVAGVLMTAASLAIDMSLAIATLSDVILELPAPVIFVALVVLHGGADLGVGAALKREVTGRALAVVAAANVVTNAMLFLEY